MAVAPSTSGTRLGATKVRQRASAGPGPQQRRRSRPGMWALGALIALLFLLPLWWTFVSALRSQDETFRTLSPVSVWTLLPRDLTFNNFVRLFDGDFGRAIFNSMVV